MFQYLIQSNVPVPIVAFIIIARTMLYNSLKYQNYEMKPKYYFQIFITSKTQNPIPDPRKNINIYDYIMKLSNEVNSTSVKYHEILPFHGNGLPKESFDYHDYFDQRKIFIRHYSQYLNHNDRYENDNSYSIFLPQNLNEDNELIQRLSRKKFTLIYLLTISKISDFFIRQINEMSHQEIAFIIFVDNKSNRTKLYNLLSQLKTKESIELFENLYLIDSPRFAVDWGQISIPMSQIVMMCSVLKYFPNSMYLSLHSESDYRIVPNEQIIKYLKSNYPNNYINLDKKVRIILKNKRTKKLFLYVRDSEKLARKLTKIYPNRLIPNFVWSIGSNWMTVTVNDAKIIIDTILNNFEIIDHLEFCEIPDETLFQTIALTAKIKFENTNHRYINWKKGGCHPKILVEEDFNEIVNNSCNFWARKFKINESSNLLDMIDNYVRNEEKENKFKICNM